MKSQCTGSPNNRIGARSVKALLQVVTIVTQIETRLLHARAMSTPEGRHPVKEEGPPADLRRGRGPTCPVGRAHAGTRFGAGGEIAVSDR